MQHQKVKLSGRETLYFQAVLVSTNTRIRNSLQIARMLRNGRHIDQYCCKLSRLPRQFLKIVMKFDLLYPERVGKMVLKKYELNKSRTSKAHAKLHNINNSD